jgi:hypothetical protein
MELSRAAGSRLAADLRKTVYVALTARVKKKFVLISPIFIRLSPNLIGFRL